MTPLAAQTMAQYNRWMNERLYELCSTLSDEERKRDGGAFFKSIHGTLNHLLLGDRIWLARFLNHDRGQLTTLLVQCGTDPGITDLIWLPEMQTAER